jgi:hypothetical protein
MLGDAGATPRWIPGPKSRTTGAALAPEALLKLAALLHEIYRSYDLCHVVLSAHDRQCGTSYSKRYIELLARQ